MHNFVKKNHRLFAKIFLLVTCGGIVLYLFHELERNAVDRKAPYLPKRGKMSLIVMGYQFDGYKKGNKIISVKAVRHSIEKKKVGFFGSGAAHIAAFKGAVIDIYGRQKNPGKRSQTEGDVTDYSFKDIFLKEVMPIFSQKDIATLRFEPVQINFFKENSLLTRIQAQKAIIKSMDGRIFLKGRISATSASRSLATDRLTLISDNGFMETNRHFILNSPEKQITGNNLTGDIRLNIVHYQ